MVEGENRNITCNVTGIPVPSISWTAVSTGSRSAGSIRELTTINRNDAGEYKCESCNVCGNDTKSTFLIVHCKYTYLMSIFTRMLPEVEWDPALCSPP